MDSTSLSLKGNESHEVYFKLAIWVERFNCFRDGKRAFGSEAEAKSAAVAPGRYRVSTVTRDGRSDGPPFVVERAKHDGKPYKVRAVVSPHAIRPMSGKPH